MRVECPHCSHATNTPDEHAGKRARCPKCKGVFIVPESPLIIPPTHYATPAPIAPPEPIQVHISAPPPIIQYNEPRLKSGGWFARSFMSATGVLLAIGMFSLVGFIAVCGGCIYVAGNVSKAVADAESKVRQEAEAKVKVNGPGAAGPEKKTTYATMGQSVTVGSVECRLSGCKIGKVPLNNLGNNTASADDLLMLTLSVDNKSQTKRLQFDGWPEKNSFLAGTVSVKDEHDNRYKTVHFGFGTDIVGDQGGETIEPGSSLTSIIVLEKPIDAANSLFVELDGSAVQQDNTTLRWKLSKADWR